MCFNKLHVMKNTIHVVIILVLIFSCKEKFNPNKFKGGWISLDQNESFNEILPTLTFKKDSVFLEDIYTYLLKGKYNLTRHNITLYLKNDTINYDFKYISKDSVIYIGKNKYNFWEGYNYNSKFIDYELLDLDRIRNITPDSLIKFDNGFHLFKDSKDALKLKLNDKFTADFNMIQRFVFGHHQFKFYGSVIYLDKKIIVKDLIKCYVQLYQVNKLNNLLITSFDLKTNSYSGIKDRIELWQEQVDLIVGKKIEPVKPIVLTRKQYLKKYSPKIIKIDSDNDFEKLTYIGVDNNYLIQINSELSIEKYIYLKEMILKIKRSNPDRIKTEFINIL